MKILIVVAIIILGLWMVVHHGALSRRPTVWPAMIEIPTYADIVAAAARIKRHAVRTPLVESAVLKRPHRLRGSSSSRKFSSAPARSSFAAR